jgi:hypothetical protein
VDVDLTPAFITGLGQRAPKQLRGTAIPHRLRHIHRYITKMVLRDLTGYLA